MFILFVFLVFENILEKYIPQIGYFDEFITIVLLTMTAVKFYNKRNYQKHYIKVYMYLGAVLLVSFLNTFFIRYKIIQFPY